MKGLHGFQKNACIKYIHIFIVKDWYKNLNVQHQQIYKNLTSKTIDPFHKIQIKYAHIKQKLVTHGSIKKKLNVFETLQPGLQVRKDSIQFMLSCILLKCSEHLNKYCYIALDRIMWGMFSTLCHFRRIYCTFSSITLIWLMWPCLLMICRILDTQSIKKQKSRHSVIELPK